MLLLELGCPSYRGGHLLPWREPTQEDSYDESVQRSYVEAAIAVWHDANFPYAWLLGNMEWCEGLVFWAWYPRPSGGRLGDIWTCTGRKGFELATKEACRSLGLAPDHYGTCVDPGFPRWCL